FDGEVWSVVREFRPNVPLSALTPLSVVHHPWAAMTARLPAGSAKAEPLARLTPAAFYYLRTDDVAALFALLDEADDWGAPLWRFMEGTTKQRQLVRRYRTLLGLPGSELAKRLGPTVIERLAVVGSDPFLRQGSDVTVIVEVKNASLFGVGLSRELEAALAGRGEPKRETVNHHGVPIAIVRSSDGAVEQHRASVGSVEVISTSRGAIERVLDTIAGRHPNLAAEADFQFMLRRDHAVPNTILAYAGERFIDNAVSPRSRILDARRQIALAELEYLGHVALLFGRIHGRAPTSRKELLASKLLEPSDLRHFDRAPIAFEPGSAPRSSWGTPARLTAIIDLPDPTRVTKIEQLAYASYAEQYGGEWLEAPDPVALRIAQDGPSGRTLRAMLRVLPLLPEHIVEDTGFLEVLVEQRTEDYLRLVELTGDSPVPVGVAREGEEVTFAISKDSSLRQQLQGLSQAYVGERLSLDWLGDRVAVGVLDRPELANAMATLGYASQMPSNV
ncbi:MAG: hypothetical protein KC731_25445, partial [Myxococcales bacterium]|nr:hypothetical protein [Myxococcales bacterium]